jgi:N-acetylmuramoyl-L-alanine amidase
MNLLSRMHPQEVLRRVLGVKPVSPERGFEPDSKLVTCVAPSPNVEERRCGARPDLLLLHYTGMASTEAAIDWLSRRESKVSCHYVIGEDGAITQMVPEALRAWHAGASHWGGVDDINSCSIGIEIQNAGHAGGCPDFPEAQIEAVIALSADIIARHAIPKQRVLAHSDVAPGRKIDPGENFPWARLAQAGIGHWLEPAPYRCGPVLELGDSGECVARLQQHLRSYGYGLEATGDYDERTRLAVEAFQRHFRPSLVDGRADRSTADTLDALLAALHSA